MKKPVLTAALLTVMVYAQAARLCETSITADERTSVSDVRSEALVFRQALELFNHGIYAEARNLFVSLSGNDCRAEGYAALCSVKMKSPCYMAEMERYLEKCPYSGLAGQIRYAHALNMFDDEDYASAAEWFAKVSPSAAGRSGLAELTFKKAYSDFETGNSGSALAGFTKVTRMPKNDYQAPSACTAGYIEYERERFAEAIDWFVKASDDPRFSDICAYYIMECRFMNKDYKYVMEHGEEMYGRIPEERRPHLARIISESYLVSGNTAKAKEYYDRTNIAQGNDRKDYFYAGSLLYALEDYNGAIENYSRMTNRTDSLGQIANYQLGYSYIQTKNKVAAMQSFKDAVLKYNPDIEEDAFFNYAKLAFDLNNDPSGFNSYIARYSDKKRGDKIYSYMALAALYSHDYAAAVEAYDKIDVLDADMQRNYMKANYLRAEQLIDAGSYRNAVPCLKAAAYYSDRRSSLNQLARYWLAESYYRADDYQEAADMFKNLYNISALDGKKEGRLLPYDVAYCYFKSGDYTSASKWFDTYLQSGDRLERTDAFTRKGDCSFISKEYAESIVSYESAVKNSRTMDDLYPYYQAGLAYALTENVSGEIRLLSGALSASPSAKFWCETVYELGKAYMSIGDNDNASGCFERIVSSGRDTTYQARALIGLGMISANQSRYEDALGYYKQVVSRMPSTDYSKDALRAIESIYQTRQEPEQYYAYLKTVSTGVEISDADRESMYFNAAEQIFLAENYQKALVSLQSYMDEYPQGSQMNLASFYMAESYRNLGKKEQACDWYRKVIESGEGSFVEVSSLSFANLSYSLERYDDAYAGYKALLDNARIENNKHTAVVGMMNSAYAAKNYESAISNAEAVIAEKPGNADDKRRAQYVQAKSYLATSDRAKALSIMKTLSACTSTPEGAEAFYLLIQDSYDQGKFTDVENQVYIFSDSGTDQTYWLAKAFILLGDAFAERGDFKQAKATFESVRDGYTPESKEDDVLDNVNMRLNKLSENAE